ncbi:MAG TPA: cysteine desulfurase NifS [Clostridiaceae bacterium]|jgi:cysteine desulfurase|nr:cysteine desulfurase NifS [Clostridiaceae bacterium]
MAELTTRTYFDHAATTPVHPAVLEAVTDVLKNSYGNPSSFYREGQTASHLLAEARATIARLIGASDASEIIFTASGSEADNHAIKGVCEAYAGKGRHLITSTVEHHAVLHTMQHMEKQGFEVTYLDVDRTGQVDPDAVRQAIRPDTILVSIMTANNEIGTINPIREIGAVCREKGVLFHTDAVQALGAIPFDASDLQVDLASFSAHKLYAPKGIGALYVRRGIRLGRLIDGGAQERNRRAGTENVAFAVGFAKALGLAVDHMEENRVRLTAMRDRLIEGLRSIPHTKLNGHPTKRLPNNVNVSFEFIEGESILLLLDAKGYMCSSGSACTSGSLDPSHVLLAIGMPHEVAHGSLRVTLGHGNTPADIERFLADVPAIIKRLRDISPLYADYAKGNIRNLISEASNDDTLLETSYAI